jgi:formylglycine-generating enzyme required for sulfatase activity
MGVTMRAGLLLAMAGGCGSEDKLSVDNAVPVAKITSHTGGETTREGATETLIGAVSDDTDAASTLSVIWYAAEEEICGPATPLDDGTTTCDIVIPAGTGLEIRLEVRDPKNALGQDTVRVLINETDAPSVTLFAPLSEERFEVGEPIPFLATISDTEDAADDLIVWFMINGEDRLDVTSMPTSDGEIAGSLTMSGGIHNVALWVEDTDGKTDQDSVTIQVVETVDTPPIVTILLPEADSEAEYVVGDLIEMSGEASDADDDAEDLTAQWESSLDGVLAVDTTVQASGAISSFSTLSAGLHVLTLSVTDIAGQVSSDSVVVAVSEVVDNPPTAQILTPITSGIYYSDLAIELSGTATDDEDDSSALLAVWTSDVDGTLVAEAAIDTDGSISEFATLSVGLHVLTLTVTDSADQTDSDTAYINVASPSSAPSCAITQPADGITVEGGDEVLFEGTAYDLDVSPTLLSVALESDKDGIFAAGTPSSDGLFAFSWDALTVNTHTITLTVTDEVGLSCTDFVVLTVSTYPTLAVDAPVDGALVNEGEAVMFSATVSDAEDSAEDLIVEWVSDHDGTLSSGPPDSSGVSSFISSALSVGTHVLTVTVIDRDGFYTTVVQSLRINSPPTAPVIEITPATPQTSDDLVAVFATSSVDPDGDAVSYSYAWLLGGEDTDEATAVVSRSETLRGQTWTVLVTPSDGASTGPAGTASVTIGNTVPAVDSATISPSTAQTHDTLSVVFTTTDADDDEVDVTTTWYVNSTLAGSESTLDGATAFEKHDEVYAVLTPDDSTDAGDAFVTDSITIINTPPTAPEVSVFRVDAGCVEGWNEMPDGRRCAQAFDTPSAWDDAQASCNDLGGDLVRLASAEDSAFIADLVVATFGSTSEYYIGFNDIETEGSFAWPDGGPVTYTNWRETEPNDVGGEDCTQVEADALWNDLPCTHVSLAHICQIDKLADDLYCEVVTESSDADDDEVTYTFAWDIDGTEYTDTATTVYEDDTVPSPELVYDETWTCTVTPSDELDTGEAGTGSYTSVEPPAEYEADFGGMMIKVAASTFEMGPRDGSSTQVVTLTRDYYMSETEVTQEQYAAMMEGATPSDYVCENCPADSVSWNMAAAFSNAVSASEGLDACYSCSEAGCAEIGYLYDCAGYRLPTEAEWEGAARCGEDLMHAGSDDMDEVGWYTLNSDGHQHPVAEKMPNACGLYDMSGNLMEWVNDWHMAPYSSEPITDPIGMDTGLGQRLRRDGSWWHDSSECTVYIRSQDAPDHIHPRIGFRIARTRP